MASAAKAEEDEDPYLVDFDEFQSTDQPKSSSGGSGGGGGGMSIKVPEAFHRADILEDSLENSQHVSAPLSLPAQFAAVRDAMRCDAMCPQVTLTSALTPAAAPAPAPPFSDVSLVGESPSRIEQINYNVVSECMYVCMCHAATYRLSSRCACASRWAGAAYATVRGCRGPAPSKTTT